MSNPQRAARLLAQTMQAQAAKLTLPRVRVVVSESLSQTASFEALRNLPVMGNSDCVLLDATGFEAMQQMQHAAEAKARAQEVAEATGGPPAPTAVSVYVLSPLDILKGRDGAHVALDAAIRQSLEPGQKVAVSLLPVNLEPPTPEEQYFLESAELAVRRTLAELNVPVLNSPEALTQYLDA